MKENIISWNLPNLVSIIFMIAILWVVIGAVGHIFVRSKSAKSSAIRTSGTGFAQTAAVPGAASA